MKNHRIIQVKYCGPTNTKGSRVILTENRGGKTEKVILSFDYASD